MKFTMIIGCDRSGTTVLAKILSQKINNSVVLPEAHWLHEYILFRKDNQPLEIFIDYCIEHKRFKPFLESKIPIIDFIEKIWRTGTNDSMGIKSEIEKILFQSAQFLGYSCNNNTTFIEHTPWNYKNYFILKEVLSINSWIHIVRDGRDVALSLVKVKWGPNNLYTASKYWTETLIEINNIFRDNNDLYTVSFESILNEPKNSIDLIIKKLNFRKGNDNFQFVIPEKYSIQHSKYKQNIDKKNQLKWKKLSKKEVSKFDYDIRMSFLLQLYKYESISFKKIHKFKKIIFHLNDLFWQVIRKI